MACTMKAEDSQVPSRSRARGENITVPEQKNKPHLADTPAASADTPYDLYKITTAAHEWRVWRNGTAIW
jgi:hypothetical protein